MHDETRGESSKSDVISFNAAISTCEKSGQCTRLAVVHGETRGESLKSDLISFNAAISTCDKSGQWQR
eukprot:8579499-Karenia_brevis.AAC.1